MQLLSAAMFDLPQDCSEEQIIERKQTGLLIVEYGIIGTREDTQRFSGTELLFALS